MTNSSFGQEAMVSWIPPTPRQRTNSFILNAGTVLRVACLHRPVDANTIYRVGSISKLITDVMLFKLADEGKISLDDPISVSS